MTKIYTKSGDSGETSLLGGKRVSKSDKRIEAYGTVDELIAFIGLFKDQNINPEIKQDQLYIQDKLMVCASLLAADNDDNKTKLPRLKEEDIVFLESAIDNMSSKLSPLTSFILPGGHQTVSLCHVIRTVCRRAERRVIEIQEINKKIKIVIRFLNRLSDYFFMLSRLLSIDFQVDEIKWKPNID